jgi:nitrate reductase gamma subunit
LALPLSLLSSPKSGSSTTISKKAGIIIGYVIAGIAGLAAIVALVLFLLQRRQKARGRGDSARELDEEKDEEGLERVVTKS